MACFMCLFVCLFVNIETVELNPDSMHAKIKDFVADCMTLFNHHKEKKTGISDLYKEVKVKACSELKVKKKIQVDLKRLSSEETFMLKDFGQIVFFIWNVLFIFWGDKSEKGKSVSLLTYTWNFFIVTSWFV